MRILYHHRTRGEGAEGVHIRQMIRSFRTLGHVVRLVSLVGEQPTNSPAANRGWVGASRFIPKGAYEAAELAYNVVGRRNVAKAIREFSPDFVYDRYNTYCTAAIDAARRVDLPTILEVNSPMAYERSVYETHRLMFSRLAQRFEKRIFQSASHIFAVSTPLKEFMVSEADVPKSQVTVLANGADPDAFDPNSDGSSIRDRFQIHNRSVIGFVGSIRQWHGLDLLLEAFKTLMGRNINAHLLLVGDGPLKSELVGKVREMNLTERVTFAGDVDHDHMQSYLAAMDVGVVPQATFYSSPMKILEYMAMGLPTAAPRMPNICDILQDQEDAILFEPKNSEAIADQLQRILSDPSLAKRLGMAARKKIEREFNWDNNAVRVIERARKLGCGNA